MVPYSRFKTVNDAKKTAERDLADLRAQLAAAPQPVEDYRERFEVAAAEVAALKLARLKANVCYQAGVPIELGERLTGDSEEAIKADLAALLRLGFGAAPTAPNINAGDRNEAPPGFSITQISNPAFYRANAAAIDRAASEGRIYG